MPEDWTMFFLASNACSRWKHVTWFSDLHPFQGVREWSQTNGLFWFVWFEKTEFEWCWEEKTDIPPMWNKKHPWPFCACTFKNEIQADYNRLISAEWYGLESVCEDCLHLNDSWKGSHASIKHCCFITDVSLAVLFYFNYMTSAHEREPKLYLHWPWNPPGGLWWNEAYVFRWFLENEETQNTLFCFDSSFDFLRSQCDNTIGELGRSLLLFSHHPQMWQCCADTEIGIAHTTASPLNICTSVNHCNSGSNSNSGSCW